MVGIRFLKIKILNPVIFPGIKKSGKVNNTVNNFIQELTHIIIDRVNHKLKNGCKVTGMQLTLAWYDRVSNGRSAPVGKPTNFSGRSHLPISYPGWSGRAWIRYNKNCSDGWGGSDPIRGTGLHTGTGGFGTYDGPWSPLIRSIFDARLIETISLKQYNDLEQICYSWDCRVFADDFPEILDLFETDRLFDTIAKGNSVQRQYSYCWNDPDTVAADKQLIERLERLGNKDAIFT